MLFPCCRSLVDAHQGGAAPRDRRAISLLAILISLVIVVLATIAVASTFVAVRALDERKRAQEDLAEASKTVDQYVLTVATHNDLKGLKMEPVRKELLENAKAHYDRYVKAHAAEEPPSPEVAAAYFHLAGLQAKLGLMDSVTSLNNSMQYLNRMRDAKVAAEVYPSLQQSAMKLAEPNEWIVLKRASFQDMQKHGLNLFMGIARGVVTYRDLCDKYPGAVGLRDDYSFLLAASATMQSRFRRNEPAMTGWRKCIDVLETLVRDEPGNTEFKNRLADAQLALGQVQKAEKDNVSAVASYKKALEIKEALAQASPGDEGLKKQVDTAKTELAKLETAAAKQAEAAPAKPEGEEPAAGTEPAAETAEAPTTAEGDGAAAETGEAKEPPAEEPAETSPTASAEPATP